MTALFEFRGVTLRRHGVDRLAEFDAVVPAAGITALIGPSGSGKSSALRCCNRLEAPTSGLVLFRDRDLSTLDPLSHRRRVGMVFQRPVTFPGTVLDNLRVADSDLDRAAGASALQDVGLSPDLLDRDADTLSGGEAQRMALARTLAAGPEVLLLDEPTSALDAAAGRLLEELVVSMVDQGLAAIWVSHDEDQVARIADHVITMGPT